MKLLEIFECYPNVHIIAFSGNMYVGYHKGNNRAFYLNDCYQSDLVHDMNDDYMDWVVPLLNRLHYGIGTIDNGIDYYEVIDRTV